MARIVVGSYMVRYPLGGMMSWTLQYLVGLQRLGHDVFLVESSGYPQACFHPLKGEMTDDCAYGTSVLRSLLGRFGLEDHWCYRDWDGEHHGMSRRAIEDVLRTADVLVDMGTRATWLSEAVGSGVRVLLDGEPATTQMRFELAAEAGEPLPSYDLYYTNGLNVGTPASTAPTAGRCWRHLLHPVVTELFDHAPPAPQGAAYTTVMNWTSNAPVRYHGELFGNKDAEFPKFLDLPQRVALPIEVAVAGPAPKDELAAHGWRVRDAHEVTLSYDRFVEYITSSRAEFGVCKQSFVATNSGWFSDRSAVYLATGRPVVLQDTGFSAHLPCGLGLLAVRDAAEAADAIANIEAHYGDHARAAREIAVEHLDAKVVLTKFLDEIGTA